MDFILYPWQFYFLILAGWVNRQQQIMIEYLQNENQVLREKFGKKRILLSDDQRRRLAVQIPITSSCKTRGRRWGSISSQSIMATTGTGGS